MKQQYYKVLNKALRYWQKKLGASCVGVRAIVINSDNQILLVKHTYIGGWHFPGGGVDNGETTQAAVLRELQEEVGVTVNSEPELFGIYHHKIRGVDDYPVIYIVKDFKQVASHDPEIEKHEWFDVNNLPSDTTPATSRRVQEYKGKRKRSEHW